ncbi:hypothetical protein ABH14_09975 [Brevibacillus brevis]|uniref:DUF4199 domain-containing protein n=1 Tax=Brevibacillus brevis TaxID=1393 RepID=UPI0019027638|nr:DUF4199 domain-containing protein [Brevibacillus brevis]MBH0330118.1 hypothetical protein [Brevibacillus brevis]
MKKCFVVCPIGADGSEIRKRSDQVLKHIITPTCERNDYEVVRVDRIHDSDAINQTIIKHLRESELVITDLTDHNPNAFFETGYRLALGKPMIQLIQEGQSLPFDVAGTRTIFYNLYDPDKLENTKEKLYETIKAVTVDSAETEDDDSQGNQAKQVNSQIISMLFEIIDSIQGLNQSIRSKQQSDIEAVVSALTKHIPSAHPSPEAKLMEMVIPEMLNNPEKISKLMSLFPEGIKR